MEEKEGREDIAWIIPAYRRKESAIWIHFPRMPRREETPTNITHLSIILAESISNATAATRLLNGRKTKPMRQREDEGLSPTLIARLSPETAKFAQPTPMRRRKRSVCHTIVYRQKHNSLVGLRRSFSKRLSVSDISDIFITMEQKRYNLLICREHASKKQYNAPRSLSPPLGFLYLEHESIAYVSREFDAGI